MLGLGDGVFFVWFLTLLVKKKEKRGRRVSAGMRDLGPEAQEDTLVCLRFENENYRRGCGDVSLVYITLVNFERKTVKPKDRISQLESLILAQNERWRQA